MRFTQSELVRYALNQVRPVFESCVGETEIYLFFAYTHDYNSSRRPAGTRARAITFARAPDGAAHLTRRVSREPIVCCAGTSQRARQAARDARGEAPPASHAPEAGPSVFNPSIVPVRSGKQQQARKRGAHEPTAERPAERPSAARAVRPEP